ncbi:MAG: LptF/LptG family permease [Alphaproteobacteria bacterium]|nr:LptF/LptG family permease [Alphaproteobacteria bacterium]
MKLTGVLSRYIIKIFFKCVAVVMVCFGTIVSLIEIMELSRRMSVSQIHFPIRSIVLLTVMKTIATISHFFPFVVFLGSIIFFTRMHSKLELTVIKVSGVSLWQKVKTILAAICIIGVFYITVFDKISSYSVSHIGYIQATLKGEIASEKIQITSRGAWLKDSSQNERLIIYGRLFDSQTTTLNHVKIFRFDKENSFKDVIYAHTATITNKYWILSKATITKVDGTQEFAKSIKLHSNLNFSRINKMVSDPAGIPFWRIHRYISTLKNVGLSTSKYELHFFMKIASIVQMFALSMLAMAFCINYNSRNTRWYAIKVAVLILSAFPLNFATNVLAAYGENGTLNMLFAAFVIPIFTVCSAFILLRR